MTLAFSSATTQLFELCTRCCIMGCALNSVKEPHTCAAPAAAVLLLQGAFTTVAERVLRVSWPILPIGLVLSTAVCAFVLWRSAAQGGDLQYQQAVVAHGTWQG
jgi:hypothetical protein